MTSCSSENIDFSLYVITTEIEERKRSHLEVAEEAIAGGATVIQLREKVRPVREILEIAFRLKELCFRKSVPLIINDRVDIAQTVSAAGVHVGSNDLPVPFARSLLGEGKIVGASVTSVKEAIEREREGADYLGAGPVFPTPSKDDPASPIGLEELRKIKEAVKIPVVAIGGINKENLYDVLETGVDGVAVISAVALAEDIRAATEELVLKIRKVREKNDIN